MAKQRPPKAKSAPKSQLGDSWVVKGDSEESDDLCESEQEPHPDGIPSKHVQVDRRSREATESPRRRASYNSRGANIESDFIMPSIHENQTRGSRANAEGRTRMSQISSQQNHASDSRSIISRESKKKESNATNTAPLLSFLESTLIWVLDIFGKALNVLKTPIAYVLAIYLLVGMFILLRNLLTGSLYSALSPICRIPGSSLLQLDMCRAPVSVNYRGEQTPPVEFEQLMTTQSKFEEVLEQSAGGVSLPLDMKRGETSIRDLRQVVRFSQLHSKNELVLEFDGFIDTARIASYDLQKFNSHVGRGVDNILATARWTKRVLDGIAFRDDSRGVISSFVSDRLLAPFQPLKFTEDALLDQYVQHTRIVEEEIQRLVEEAQILLMVLQNLEDRLDIIHGISVRDNLHAKGSRDEVLSQLWTMLGGNRSKLGKYDNQLQLLQQVNQYRQSAFAHVSGTILKLQAIGAELEELRERVGSAELLRDRAQIPLSVHIENIQLGVERLEAGRSHAKQVENEHLRKSLDRGSKSEMKGRGLIEA
ncbi:hypothetical protein MMC09_004599 [Bachmanniomyces sp. S44760]|nr:hypothetical protein [Bachmanniomyces sp. S44760]